MRRRCIPNYLATETDRRTIIDGLKLGRRLLATPEMQHFITAEYIPGPQVQTDDELLRLCEAVRRHGVPSHQHVQDGQRSDGGGRSGTARARYRQSPRGRCVDHAGGGVRQHQCRDDHDRGEGGRSDPPGTTARRRGSPHNQGETRWPTSNTTSRPTSSWSAPAPPAASWRRGCPRTRRPASCCWRPAARTATAGSTSPSATARPSPMRR